MLSSRPSSCPSVNIFFACHDIFVHSGAIFTALHGMQTRSCDEISVCPCVCPSVRLSNACVVTKRKKNLSRFLYHAKDHSV